MEILSLNNYLDHTRKQTNKVTKYFDKMKSQSIDFIEMAQTDLPLQKIKSRNEKINETCYMPRTIIVQHVHLIGTICMYHAVLKFESTTDIGLKDAQVNTFECPT